MKYIFDVFYTVTNSFDVDLCFPIGYTRFLWDFFHKTIHESQGVVSADV